MFVLIFTLITIEKDFTRNVVVLVKEKKKGKTQNLQQKSFCMSRHKKEMKEIFSGKFYISHFVHHSGSCKSSSGGWQRGPCSDPCRPCCSVFFFSCPHSQLVHYLREIVGTSVFTWGSFLFGLAGATWQSTSISKKGSR